MTVQQDTCSCSVIVNMVLSCGFRPVQQYYTACSFGVGAMGLEVKDEGGTTMHQRERMNVLWGNGVPRLLNLEALGGLTAMKGVTVMSCFKSVSG